MIARARACNAGSLPSLPMSGANVSRTAFEAGSEGGTVAAIENRDVLCSGLEVLPVFGNARISVTILARTLSSWHRRQIASSKEMAFALVSEFDDFEADKTAGTSLDGSTAEMSCGQLISRWVVTSKRFSTLGSSSFNTPTGKCYLW